MNKWISILTYSLFYFWCSLLIHWFVCSQLQSYKQWSERNCWNNLDVNRKSIYQLTCEHSEMLNTSPAFLNIYYKRHEMMGKAENRKDMNSSTLMQFEHSLVCKNCNVIKYWFLASNNVHRTHIYPWFASSYSTLFFYSNEVVWMVIKVASVISLRTYVYYQNVSWQWIFSLVAVSKLFKCFESLWNCVVLKVREISKFIVKSSYY